MEQKVINYFSRVWSKEAVLKCTWTAFCHSSVSFWPHFLPLFPQLIQPSHTDVLAFFFSIMPNSLPPHSWSPYWRLPLPGISFPLLFGCLLSSLIQLCSHVTFWENLLWRPYLLKHTCFSPFTLILAVHISLQLISWAYLFLIWAYLFFWFIVYLSK